MINSDVELINLKPFSVSNLSYKELAIHLNPIKLIEPTWKETGVKNRGTAEKFLEEFQHSSYLDYCGTKRVEGLILNKSSLPTFCTAAGDFKKEIKIWLNKG